MTQYPHDGQCCAIITSPTLNRNALCGFLAKHEVELDNPRVSETGKISHAPFGAWLCGTHKKVLDRRGTLYVRTRDMRSILASVYKPEWDPPSPYQGDELLTVTLRREAVEKLLLLDCQDNSCVFGGSRASGMRTNGGCRCLQELSPGRARIVNPLLQALMRALPKE